MANTDDGVIIIPENHTVEGTEGNDLLYGWPLNDWMYGYGGDLDIIRGRDGYNFISGGAGRDLIKGGDDPDQIFGDSGDDKIDGGESADDVYGGAGNDRVYGGLGTDNVVGGDGNDALYGGKGGTTEGDGYSDHFLFDTDDGNDIVFDAEDNDRFIFYGAAGTTIDDVTIDYNGKDTFLYFFDTVVRVKGLEVDIGQIDIDTSGKELDALSIDNLF